MLNLGNTYNRMARHKEAVASLTTAVQLDPSNWQGTLNLGNSLCGDSQEIPAMRTPIRIPHEPSHPPVPNPLYRLAAQSTAHQAETYVRPFAAAAAAAAAAAVRCGATVTGLGELAKVLELYRQLAKGHPENQAYSFRFAYFLLLSGDAAGAAKWARAALHAQVEHAADYGPALWVLGITERGGLHRPAQPTDKTTGFGALRAKVLLNPPSTAWLE